jgi:hypothetical protein
MDKIKKITTAQVEDALDKISDYLSEHIDENLFKTKIIPVMIKSIEALNYQLSDVEKESIMVAKRYWENNSANVSDLKQTFNHLINLKHPGGFAKYSVGYYRIEAIKMILFTIEDWDDEADISLRCFYSNLLKAEVPLRVFYRELEKMFGDIIDTK